MYYPEEIIEDLRSRSNIVDVISEYMKLSRKGSSYMGLCPFHSEKTPSFSVSPARQSYHCFGCGASGDVYSFVMEYDNKTFQEAVQTLAARAGMELPGNDEGEEGRKTGNRKKRLLEIQKIAAVHYYKELYGPGGRQALAYFRGRGLSDETIRSFGLGYSGKGGHVLYDLLKKEGFTDAELKDAGLFTVFDAKKEIREKFWNRVMFPIMDVNKRVIGFGGRVMGDAKPKYLNSPETLIFDKSANLYGLHAAKVSRKKQYLLCEGYMDVISLHMHGFTNAVATLGTALTSRQASVLHRYVGEVLLMYDSDEAGVRAALRAIPILRNSGVVPKVVDLSPCKDPDELLKAKGREFLEERLGKAENGFFFEIRQLAKDYDLRDPEGSGAFQHELAKRLAEFSDEIGRESYLKAIAGIYHIDEKLLRRQIGRLTMAGYAAGADEAPTRRREPVRAGSGKTGKAEEAVLSWIYAKPELAETVRKYLTPKDFSEGVRRKLSESLLAKRGTAPPGNSPPVTVLNGFEESEERAEAAAVLESRDLPGRPEEQKKALIEAIVLIRKRKIDEAVANAAPDDMAAFQDIMEQIKQLESIKKLLSGGK